MKVKEIADRIFLCDNHLYSIPEFGATYILNEDIKVIVDCGPTTSASYVLEALNVLNLHLAEIDYIIATHIHLDHAGGAGYLLRQMPKAKIGVHAKGARHLIDPARLVSSMKEVLGKDGMSLNGEVVPVKESRVQILADGDKLKLSDGQVLNFMNGQGHSPHQIIFYESRNGGIFVGDAVANYDSDFNVIEPITPPPSFDYDEYLATLGKIENTDARMIYFPHFGASGDVHDNLKLAKRKLEQREQIADMAAAEGRLEEAAKRIQTAACNSLAPLRRSKPALGDYWCENSLRMSAEGFIKNYRERKLLARS